MSFDTLAPHYRWMEWLLAGRKLQRCRIAHLDGLGGRSQILLLGEGNGRFLQACVARFPQADLTVVDASLKMLEQARWRGLRKGLDLSRVQFVHADLLEWQPPRAYDLLVSNFFLDCFQPAQLKSLIGKLAAVATPEAEWLVADFALPARGLGRVRARGVHKLMYLFFRCATGLSAFELTAPDEILQAHGFELAERRLSEWGLLHADRWRRFGAGSTRGLEADQSRAA
jgi:ubiquinone/menaquinone biosynthesis C-methylase UbiE